MQHHARTCRWFLTSASALRSAASPIAIASAFGLLSISAISTPALAACVDSGGNDFTITDGGANLDVDCAGAADGATATINGAITGTVVDSLAAPNGWNYVVTNGASVTSAARTIDSTGPGASLDNAGTITSTAPSITFAESEGVVFHAGGTINNQASGTIEGQIFAVRFGLVGTGTGTGTLTNAGVISNAGAADGFDAVRLDGGGQVDNLVGGQISGAATGVNSQSGSLVLNNWGTIEGNRFGVYGAVSDTLAIKNFSGGVIAGAAEYGIWVQGTGTITNEEGGRIEGVGEGIWLDGSGSVINAGTIIGSDGPLANYDEIAAVYIDEGALTNTATGTLTGHNYGAYFERGAGTVTNAGTITGTGITGAYFGAGGTLDNSAGGTIIGGVNGVVFAGAAGSVTNAGTITGNGGIGIQFASGNFDDVLELHAGSQINGTVLAGGGTDTLRFDGTGKGSFDLGLIDEGAGTQQYRGFETFEVADGAWHFSGSTTQTLTANGGTVAGTGTLGGLVLNAGATLAPGNSIGTITINGDVQFNDGSIYLAEVNADGSSDLLIVNGQTTIAPGSKLIIVGPPGQFPLASTYNVINANGGVTGQFASVMDQLPDIDLATTYLDGQMQISYVPASSAEEGGFSEKGIHPSATQTALSTHLGFSRQLRHRGAFAAADGNSGDAASNTALGYLPHPTPAQRDIASSPQSGWTAWSSVVGVSTRTKARDSALGTDDAVAGFNTGIEKRFAGGRAAIGVAGGYSVTNTDVGLSRGEIDSWHIGAYGGARLGAFTLSGSIGYAHQTYEFNRLIAMSSGPVMAEGEANGYSVTASGDIFYDVMHRLDAAENVNSVRFGPFAAVDAIFTKRGGFSETGAGVLDLTVAEDTARQTVLGLGLGFDGAYQLGTKKLTIDGRIGWEYIFGDRQATSGSAIPIANANFVTGSAPIDRNRFAVSIGASMAFSDRVSSQLRYDGNLSGSTTSHSGSLGLTVKF